jgi:hypothetical protein
MKKLLIINLIAVVFISILVLILINRADMLPEQTAYTRYASTGDVPYGQVSIFYAGGMPIDTMLKTEYDLSKATESLVKNIRGEAVSSAYSSAPTDIMFESRTDNDESLRSAKLSAYFTGGSFFLFHPYEIISGNYLDSGTIMRDNAVLDENAAWQLFGSTDVVGRFIYAGDVPVHISGVIRRFNTTDLNMNDDEDDTRPFIYLDYELAAALTGMDALFSTFEAVLPSPVPGAALESVKNTIGMSDGVVSADRLTRIVDNAERHNAAPLFDILTDLPALAVKDDSIILPAWENEARMRDTTSALILGLICVIGAIPAVSLAILFVIFIRFLQNIPNKIGERFRSR